MKKILVGAQGRFGATFLEWSIQYLSGQQQYWTWNSMIPIDLINDPLRADNAHGFTKNHPIGFVNSAACITALEQSNCALASFYPARIAFDERSIQDYIDIYKLANARNWYIVYIKTDNFLLYGLPGREFSNPDRNIQIAQQMQYWQNLAKEYFPDVIKSWSTYEIWDAREQIALNIDARMYHNPALVWPMVHQVVDFFDLCHDAEIVIRKVCACLNIEICESRLPQWQSVYQRWKTAQYSRMWLDININHVIRCILNNWEFHLPNLDLFQEAMILRKLIHDHNVNLKCFGMHQYPRNTQHLYQLLEPNNHSII